MDESLEASLAAGSGSAGGRPAGLAGVGPGDFGDAASFDACGFGLGDVEEEECVRLQLEPSIHRGGFWRGCHA